MPRPKICSALAMIVMMAATPAFAADDQHEQHHPGATAPAVMPASPGMAQQGSQPGGMPGMGTTGTPPMPMMGMGREGGMPGMPMDMMRSMMSEGGMMARMPMMGSMPMMAERTEGRIAFLKAELKITETQLPLWNAVADALRATAKTGTGMMEGMGGKLPDRLAAQEKMLSTQVEALRKFKSVVDPLYAALSDEQKKTADELLMSPMGMM